METIINVFFPTDWALLILRFGVGLIFIYHGVLKLVTWRPATKRDFPSEQIGTMRLLSIAEPLGGGALILGFLTQLAAVGLAAIMFGAIYYKLQRWHVPFAAMNKTGWEFDFLILIASLSLVFAGGGAISIDNLILGF